jgi:hypothetical protein
LVLIYPSADSKGNFVIAQIPIALQLALLNALGLTDFQFVKQWTFPLAYAFLVPPTLALIYFTGLLLTWAWGRSRLLVIFIALSPLIYGVIRAFLRTLYRVANP